MGCVAAGSPIEAVEQHERVDFGELFDPDRHAALRVRGESMRDDGIFDGDIVVIDRHRRWREGDAVVALVDGEDATLKRIYRAGQRYRLQPANSTMQPMFRKHVQVVGIVVGVFRAFR